MPQRFRIVLVLAAGFAVALVGPADAVKRRAFVTSVSGTGNLASWPDAGGQFALAAGDSICRARAASASLPNSSTYRVWLSTAATDAYCHVQGRAGKKATGCSGLPRAAGPAVLVNGVSRFTGTLDQLTGPEHVIYQAVQYDEFGGAPSSPGLYWTGTSPSGEAVADTCSSWVVSASDVEGLQGGVQLSAVQWTQFGWNNCNALRHLLCFEPGESEATPVPWQPSALVFVTSAYGTGDLSSWPNAGGETGIAAGDAICRSLAATAHLPAPDSFFAWLSDSTTDAGGRLTPTASFRRVDHFRVALSKASLLSAGNDYSVHVDETGAYIGDHTTVWTGTTATGDGAGGGAQCVNWSTSAVGADGLEGRASKAHDGEWTEHLPDSCMGSNRFYCFSNVVTIFWDGFETGDTSRWSNESP